MFRRAVFALMLIGAAFVGGAAINGPGLAWFQRNFVGGPSIIVDNTPARPASGSKPLLPKQFPTAKAPPLQVDLPRNSPASRKKNVGAPAELLAMADAPLLPESPSTPASALVPLPEPTSTDDEADPPIPPLPSEVAEAPSRPVSPAPATAPAPRPGPGTAPQVRPGRHAWCRSSAPGRRQARSPHRPPQRPTGPSFASG